MTFNQPPFKTTDITLNGSTLKQVTDFKYLGSKMASSETDFLHRKSLAWVAFWNMEKLWRGEHVPTRLKINIFKSSVISCSTEAKHGVWASLWRTSSTALPPAATASCRLDKISNEIVLERVDQHLLIESVRKRQLRWVGHALLRDESKLSRKFVFYEPSARQAPARASSRKLSRADRQAHHLSDWAQVSHGSAVDAIGLGQERIEQENCQSWRLLIVFYFQDLDIILSLFCLYFILNETCFLWPKRKKKHNINVTKYTIVIYFLYLMY